MRTHLIAATVATLALQGCVDPSNPTYRPEVSAALFRSGLAILANPQGYGGSPMAGVAQGFNQGFYGIAPPPRPQYLPMPAPVNMQMTTTYNPIHRIYNTQITGWR